MPKVPAFSSMPVREAYPPEHVVAMPDSGPTGHTMKCATVATDEVKTVCRYQKTTKGRSTYLESSGQGTMDIRNYLGRTRLHSWTR